MIHNTSSLEHFIAMMKNKSVALNEESIHEFIKYAVKIEGGEYLNELEREICENNVNSLDHLTIDHNDLGFIKRAIIRFIDNL